MSMSKSGGMYPSYTVADIPSRALDYLKTFGLKRTFSVGAGYLNYQLHHRFLKGFVKRRIHDYEMWLDSSDPGLSRELIIIGDREQQLRAILLPELKRGDVVLDLGANIGYYALMLANRVGPEGHVYALEPSPKNVELLKRNLALNRMGADRVEVFPYAGSNKNSAEKLFISEFSNLNTMVPEDLKGGAMTPGMSGRTVEVTGVALSDFLKGKRPVQLMRMDIEGYEVEVLQGLRDAVRSGEFTGKICFEVHTRKYDDQKRNMRAELEFLFENGYQAKVLTSIREDRSRLRELGYEPDEVVRTRLKEMRGIYRRVKQEHALDLVSRVGGVRDVLLSKN